MGSFRPPGDCPNCGDYVDASAEACPSCGSCPRTGWNDDADYDALDLPEDEQPAHGMAEPRLGLAGKVAWTAGIALLIYFLLFR